MSFSTRSRWVVLAALSVLVSDAFQVAPTRASRARLTVRCAEEGPVEKLFGLFFGKTVEQPLGFDRITVEKNPERYRAATDKFADPVRGDSRDVAVVRPLMAQTRLEKTPLRLAFDANKDGWTRQAFHRKVDNQGSALVVAKTKGGAICGGYNPEGWEGVGDERAAIAAFLFTWRDGQVKKQPVKLPKVGPADYAIDDNPALAIKMGFEDFVVKLNAPNPKAAVSKLGSGYAKLPDGSNTLFTKAEGRTAELVDLKVYVPKK